MSKQYTDRADDVVQHIEAAQSEINKAISKINPRNIWLKLSSLYRLAAVLGKLEYVKEEMNRQEGRRYWLLKREGKWDE